jgi:hypothetical protein
MREWAHWASLRRSEKTPEALLWASPSRAKRWPQFSSAVAKWGAFAVAQKQNFSVEEFEQPRGVQQGQI